MAPAVVTVALNSIKEQSELHTAGSMMRACMLDRDDGSNGGAQTQDQGIVINTGNDDSANCGYAGTALHKGTHPSCTLPATSCVHARWC